MKAPVIWLKDFTDIDVSAKELADKMTLTGSKVEEVIDYKLSGVYAAKIVSVAEHPDSDHLHILKVEFFPRSPLRRARSEALRASVCAAQAKSSEL